MLYVLAVSYLAVQVLLWSLLFGFGAWLYKRFRLRTLPWLGAYVAVSFLVGRVTAWFIGALLDRGSTPPHRSPGVFLVLCYYSEGVLQGLGGVVLAVLILAEITALLARVTPALDLWLFRYLLPVRERAWPLGVVLLVLAFALPGVACIWWLI